MRARIGRPSLTARAIADEIRRIHPPAAWYDASRIVGAIDGVRPDTWPDLSGNGYHLTRTAGSPTYRSRVAALNNRPAVEFDGATNFRTASEVTWGLPTNMMLVFQITGGANAQHPIDGRDINRRQSIYSDSTGARWSLYGGTTEVHGPSRDLLPHIFTGSFKSGSDDLYVDGTVVAAGNGGDESLSGVHLGSYAGGSGFFTGMLAEVIIWDRLIPSTEHHYRLGRLLAKKYGTTWQPGA